MPKKPHPADAANSINAADLAKATFQATLFLGTGKFDKATADTLSAIRAKAREMEKAAGPNSRKAIIHAMINGRAIPVPASYDGGKPFDPAALGGKAKPKPAEAAKAAKAKPAAKAKGNGKTKTEIVIAMLRKGATRAAIVEATEWQVDLKALATRKGLKLKKAADGTITATGGE